MKEKNKVGIYGGSFNPPHLGHFQVATEAIEKYKLDCVIFVPVYKLNPEYKSSEELIKAKHRLQMLKLGIECSKYKNLCVSDVEIKRKGVSYTLDTLKLFTRKNRELYFICGSDTYGTIYHWKGIDEILKLIKKFIKFDRNKVNISSTEIREKIKKGLSVDYLLPKNVNEYIKREGLYK
jgi:nicotinate-nucleotide adenylyltransferase